MATFPYSATVAYQHRLIKAVIDGDDYDEVNNYFNNFVMFFDFSFVKIEKWHPIKVFDH